MVQVLAVNPLLERQLPFLLLQMMLRNLELLLEEAL
jgi:hypothetical protein